MSLRTTSLRRLTGLLVAGALTLPLACSDPPPADADADADADTDAEVDPCPGGCLIEGACLEAGSTDRANSCRRCDPERDEVGWSDDDDATCDDGAYCTIEDLCSGGECRGRARGCDDGVDCNGAELCDEEARACAPGASPCVEGELCDPAADRCVSTCEGCVISGSCFAPGAPNPENGCQRCDAESPEGWSDADGEPCDDGLFCDGADLCEGGACVDQGGRPCGADEGCDEAADACCQLEAELACDGGGDLIWLDGCGRPGALVEDCPDAHGRCEAGACGCEPGWRGEGCVTCVVHVDGTTGDDASLGTSWSEALATVGAAIERASGEGCEVWVAAGTYLPTDGVDRSASFMLSEGVSLYGGFVGDEESRSESDPEASPTILSGDIGTPGDPTDNSYHVVTGADGARLEGFVVTGGHADGEGSAGVGGGLFNAAAAPTVVACRFLGNAAQSGGAVYSSRGAPRFEGCTFEDNLADFGGAMHNDDAETVAEGCTFRGNVATARGGAVRNLDGAPHFIDCTFEDNEASLGGAMATSSAAPVITRGAFRGNLASGDGGALYFNGFATAALGGSLFEDNEAGNDGGAIHNHESDTFVAACRFIGNRAGRNGGAQSSLRATPTVVSDLFEENQAAGHGGAIFNEDTDALIIASTLRANSAGGVGGGIDNVASTPRVIGSIFWANSASSGATLDQQIDGGTSRVSQSDVEGGLLAGEGNLSEDPLFEPGTSELQLGSPLIDQVDPFTLPDDLADHDGDGDGLERTPLDAAGAHRLVGESLDMGALEVQTESSPPSLLEVRAASETEVILVFDEPVDEAEASLTATYNVDGGATVLSGRRGRLGRWVHLSTTPLDECVEYTVTITGLSDVAGNPLPPGTTGSFVMPVRLALDDFDDGDLEGWTVVDQISGETSNWLVLDGQVRQLSNTYDGFDRARGTYLLWDALEAAGWVDYEITVWLGSEDDDGLGVMVRVQDEDNYDLLWLNEQHFERRLMHRRGGFSYTSRVVDGAYRLDRLQQLRVVVQGDELQFFLDDEDLFGGPVTVADPLPAGAVALFCWASDGAIFDDLSVLGACE